MEPTLRRKLDFKLVFDALADKNGTVQLEVLSSHWPSNGARPSSLPSDCLSLWSQLADSKGCLDWLAFSKGITRALEGFCSNGTSDPPTGRLQSLWEEKRARNCVSATDIEGFLKSCSKDELTRALISSRKEVYSCQAPLQMMKMARGKAVFAEHNEEAFIADTSLSQVYPPSGMPQELSTGHTFLIHSLEKFGERLSQQSTSLAERSTVLCTTRDVDGTDARLTGGTNKTYHQRAAGDTATTHVQLPPTREASGYSQHQHPSRSTLTLPRSSTHSRRAVHDSPHSELESHLTPEHATLSRSMMAMRRRPSPSGATSVQGADNNLPHQDARHSSATLTLPRRSCSSESPSIKVAPTATDQYSHKQQQNSRTQSSAGKTHKRSHSLASYPSTTTKPVSASSQLHTKVTPTRVPATATSLDHGPISDL
eukprot:Em0016g282a